MKIYNEVHSSFNPPAIEITTDKVYIPSNINNLTFIDGDRSMSYYEYTITEYTKDEYLTLLSERNANLQQELLDTQSALCDVYELLEGGLE